MSFSLSQHPLSPPSSTFPTPPKFNPTPLSPHLKLTPSKPPPKTHLFIPKTPKSTPKNDNNDTQISDENNNDTDTSDESRTEGVVDMDSATELGEQIKKAMKERGEKDGGDFWSGVAEEIREIEWPAFNKVLGTTGVVLGVIAGSSVVLLTVNAVLAELSDAVFAGKGVQDFFS